MRLLPSKGIFKTGLEQVLIMQLDDTSAVVMLSPALRVLREAMPHVELTLMTSAAGSQMAPWLLWVDHVMVDRLVGQEVPGDRLMNAREEIAFIEERLRFAPATIKWIVSMESIVSRSFLRKLLLLPSNCCWNRRTTEPTIRDDSNMKLNLKPTESL